MTAARGRQGRFWPDAGVSPVNGLPGIIKRSQREKGRCSGAIAPERWASWRVLVHGRHGELPTHPLEFRLLL